MRNTERHQRDTVQSVDRAITILETLAREGTVGVTELAAALDVHKSTASRLVSALERRSLVEQVEQRGKYRLGTGILRLAGATSARLDLVQEARPILRRLAADTGETVNLVVLSGGAALYIDQIVGPSTLSSYNWVGQHIPLHATSNGKVLLAGLTRREAEVLVLLARGLSNPAIATELTISRKTVSAHLEHIYAKLGVTTRTEAALFAMRHGLTDPVGG